MAKGSGSAGSGSIVESSIDFEKTGVQGPLNFDTFGCEVFRENPDTPDKLNPDVDLVRKFFGNGRLETPDGRRVKIWGFFDPESDERQPFPSTLIRVRQGQVVHVTVENGKGSHTIHHHAIEPTTFNDGTGHTSFEVTGAYTYQWQPAEAGTFFYHCHKNTVLHFEMGMYGYIVVDPPEGPGRAFEGGPAYDVEAFWAPDDIDPKWHELNHDAGLCGEDVGLNDFNPDIFVITGVPTPLTLTDPRVAVKARLGQKILVRMLNASYSIIRTTIQGLDAQVIAIDGHALGTPDRPWSKPFTIRAGQPFELTTAQRFDLLIDASVAGSHLVTMQFLDWITREIQDGGNGVAKTKITVEAAG
jgi:FtsP/CotA-like multicopper oxidase with cupredoxin domain